MTKYLNQKGLPTKAILLLDNAPSHPPAELLRSEDGNIFVVYMPPNVTPLIQPMDQNVIRITKLYYRSALLASIVSANVENASNILKKLSIKDAVINLSLAWNKVDASTIQKCWKNILSFEEENDPEEDIPLSILKEKYQNDIEAPMNEVIDLVNELTNGVQLSREEIQTWNQDIGSEDIDSEVEDDDQEQCIVTTAEISTTEAIEAFNKVIAWSENNISDINDILALRKCRDKALQKSLEAKKVQKNITDYFHVN